MVASGFAGLAYQIVWTQQSTLWLGHESAAVLAVVAAFFGGVALGALAFGNQIDRSPHPARWYATCEVVIGVWSLVLAALLQPTANAMLMLIGTQPTAVWQWSVSFCGTLILLLPATMAMGATLPAIERVLSGISPSRSNIGALYAANTLGAMLGVLASAFWLIPAYGLFLTAGLCAALNMACAIAALQLPSLIAHQSRSSLATPARSALALLAATGLLGIGYEVLIVRALSQVAENTVFTFAILLAVYLAGTALGAAAYARSSTASMQLHDRLLQWLAIACLIGTLMLASAENIKAFMLQILGTTMTTALLAETALAIIAFLLPTTLMGALFSQLSSTARTSGISLGHSLGFNTLGAAIAPLLFGIVLMPWLGLETTLFLISGGYLLLTTRPSWNSRAQWSAVAAVAAGIALAPAFTLTYIPPGGHLVSRREGVMATVSVVEDADGIATLHINNRQQEGSSATLYADARQALIPIALHSSPHRALFLGVGTGLTASAATTDLQLQVDAVELVPEVLTVSEYFSSSFAPGADPSRLHLISADARRFLRTTPERYDVIVADNFHPARSGSGSLYTVGHFTLIQSRLRERGLFCQWLPLHQLDLDTLRSIVRTFQQVYPNATAILATNSLDTPVLGLVARRDAGRFDLAQLRQRLHDGDFASQLAQFGIDDDLSLLGSFVAGPNALSRFAGDAPLNTDDRPVVSYRAPHITYAPDSLPRDRLISLLRQVDISPQEIVSADADVAWAARLSAYWNARDRFVEAGREVEPTSDVERMIAQVREPLLSVLRTSPDFRPAYDPLLQMAAALGRIDPEASRSLLNELQHAQPSRPEAGEILAALANGPL